MMSWFKKKEQAPAKGKTAFSWEKCASSLQTWLHRSLEQYRALPTAPSSPLTVLSGLCLALGLAGLVGSAYSLQQHLVLMLAVSAVTALLTALCAWNRRSFTLYGLTAAGLTLLLVLLMGPTGATFKGLAWGLDNIAGFFSRRLTEVYPEVTTFAALLAALVSGFIGGLSAGRRHVWVGLPVVTALIYLLWKLGLSVSVLYAALAAFALIMIQVAAYQFPILKDHSARSLDRMLVLTLPVAVVLVALCLWNATVTTRYYHSVGLERRIHYTQDALSVVTKKSAPRTPFSLARMGNRLFVNRLGGPVSPDPTTVLLHVDSRHELGLKGAVYNEYTGNNWKDTTHSQRYALNSSNRALQKEVYDLDVMDDKLHVPYTYTEVTVTLPRASSHSALFVPYRVDEFQVDGFMTLYPFFNGKGEVFSARNIEKGISYTVSARLPDFDGVSFRRIWQNMAVKTEEDQEKLAQIDRLYTALPESVSPEIYALAEELTRDAVNELEAALAIRQYLAENCTYTLDVVEPAPEVEFVAHFLETREGYCSYYASAMAVLARAAGLPSRYVEGFNIDTKGMLTNKFYLTAADSHAWAEVYVEGLGWVPMDPLVVEVYEQNSNTNQNHQGTGISTAPEEDYDPYEAYGDQLDLMDDLHVMEPVTLWQRYWPLWVALIVIVPTLILVPLLHPDARRYRKARQSLRGAMRWEYEEIMRLLACLNLPRKDGETLRAYAERVSPWVKLENPTIRDTMEHIARFSYTRAKPSLSDLRRLEAAHRALKRYCRKPLGFIGYVQLVLLRGRITTDAPKAKPARTNPWKSLFGKKK